MRADPLHVVVNDLGVPPTVRKVLIWSLQFSGIPLRTVWVSQLPLVVPPRWRVKGDVGARLAARVQVLRGEFCRGPAIYLDGRTVLNGDIGELVASVPESAWLVAERVVLKAARFFLVNPELPAQPKILGPISALYEQGSQKDTYEDLAEFAGLASAIPLPDAWRPSLPRPAPRDRDDASGYRIIDCARLTSRPWYSADTPAGRLWLRQLRSALGSGELSREDIQRDVEAGLIRPSLLYECDGEIGELGLPHTIRDLDRLFQPPEMALSLAQRTTIQTKRFEVPWHPIKHRQAAPRRRARKHAPRPLIKLLVGRAIPRASDWARRHLPPPVVSVMRSLARPFLAGIRCIAHL